MADLFPAQPVPPLAPYDTSGVEAAFDSVLDAVLVVDDGGVVVYANRAAERLFGYPQPELTGAPVEILVPEPFRGPHADHRRHYAAGPTSRPMGVGPPLTAVRRDGAVFPLEISLAPMPTADGSFTTVVARDLSARSAEDTRRDAELRAALDRRALERELLASDHRFRVAFEKAPIGMALVDARPGRERTILRANATLAEMLGVPADELKGRLARDFVRRDPGDQQVDRERVESGDLDQLVLDDVRLRRPDGGQRWATVTSSVVRDADGDPDYLVTQVVDVTRRNQAEVAAAERNARDSRIARVLQASLVPYVPRRVGPVRAASRYRPAGHGEVVGGDWSDVLSLPDGRIGVVVGDVAGHGIESAATMTRLRTAVRMLATSGVSPAGVMRRLNDLMHETDMVSDIDLATLVYAQLDPGTDTLRYCSAGNLPLLLLAAEPDDMDGTPRRAVSPVPAVGGPPIGVIPEWRYSEQAVTLEPGGTLIGFTDGLIERRGEDLDMSLLQLLDGLSALPASVSGDVELLADAVLDLSPGVGAEDDIAVIVLGYAPDREAVDDLARVGGSGRPTGGLIDLIDLAEIAVRPPDRWA